MHARIHKPTNTVVCLASNPANLHNKYGDQLGLSKDYEDRELLVDVRVGDLADGTAKPENYPQPSDEEVREAKIQAEMQRIAYEEAEQSLIDKGEIEAASLDARSG